MSDEKLPYAAHRVKFFAVAHKIRLAVSEGMPVSQIWEQCEKSDIPGISYSQFARHVKKLMAEPPAPIQNQAVKKPLQAFRPFPRRGSSLA